MKRSSARVLPPFVPLMLSMVVFGTIGVFRRYTPVPSGILAMLRGFIGAAFLVLLMRIKGHRPDRAGIRTALFPLILSGVFLGGNWILLFEAYRYTSVAVATLCYYMEPVILLMVAPLFLHEPLSRKRVICIAVALVGILLVSGVLKTGIPELHELKGILCGLGAAVMYTGLVICNRRMPVLPVYDKTVFQLIAAAIVLLPYTVLAGEWQQPSFSQQSWLVIVIMGVVHTGVAYALYFTSLHRASVQTVALFAYIDPVVAVLLSVVWLHEPFTLLTVIGAVLLLGAAIIGEWPEHHKRC